MSRPLLVTSLAALSLIGGACTTKPLAPTAPVATAAPSAPAPVDGSDWHFTDDIEEPRLAYGVAHSDDLKLALVCRTGSGSLEVIVPIPRKSDRLVLESGGDTLTLAADEEPSQLDDGYILTARAKADDPVFIRFRALGWLARWLGDEREAMAAHPPSIIGIGRFLDRCG